MCDHHTQYPAPDKTFVAPEGQEDCHPCGPPWSDMDDYFPDVLTDADLEAMHHMQMMDQSTTDEEPCHDPWVS